MNNLFDFDEIALAIKTLIKTGEFFEIRSISKTGFPKVISGIFNNADDALKAFVEYSKGYRHDWNRRNIYITINQLNQDLGALVQRGEFIDNPPITTGDKHIINYNWLFVDFDSERLSEISSNQTEFDEARKVFDEVAEYMQGMGFSTPVKACSGNGFHLLYKIDLPNTEENKTLIQDCLTALNQQFGTDKVNIDTGNFNPARVCKLYGTKAQKGANTEERPHRMSCILNKNELDKVTVNKRELLEKLAFTKIAESVPLPESRQTTSPNRKFNLSVFMRDNGLTYSYKKRWKNAIIYFLDICPFDNDHRNGDARIFEFDNGGFHFLCKHDHCKQYHWTELRQLYDPNYKPTEYERRQQEYYNKWVTQNEQFIDESEPIKPLTPEEYNLNTKASNCIAAFRERIKETANIPAVSTGFPKLDEVLGGGLWVDTLITLAGGTGTGKTAWACCLAVNLAKQGQHVLYFSLETSRDEIISRGVSAETWLVSKNDPERSQTTISIKTGRTRYPKEKTSYNIDETNEILEKAFANYAEYADNIFIPDLEGIRSLGVKNLAQKIQEHITATGKIPFVIIDYLQLCIYADTSNASDKQKTDDVILLQKNISAGKIKPLPKMCIIALSNVARGYYEEEATLAMFKESGLIEFTSSVCLGLQLESMDYEKVQKFKTEDGEKIPYTTWETKDDHRHRIKDLIEKQRTKGNNGQYMNMELKVMKNRSGQTGKSIRFNYSPMFNYYEEVKPSENYNYDLSNMPLVPPDIWNNVKVKNDEIFNAHDAIDSFLNEYYSIDEYAKIEIVTYNDNTKALNFEGEEQPTMINAKRGTGKGRPWQITIKRPKQPPARFNIDAVNIARTDEILPIPPADPEQLAVWDDIGEEMF